jgi:hypothetical protein
VTRREKGFQQREIIPPKQVTCTVSMSKDRPCVFSGITLMPAVFPPAKRIIDPAKQNYERHVLQSLFPLMPGATINCIWRRFHRSIRVEDVGLEALVSPFRGPVQTLSAEMNFFCRRAFCKYHCHVFAVPDAGRGRGQAGQGLGGARSVGRDGRLLS